jgi:hypothetical protein
MSVHMSNLLRNIFRAFCQFLPKFKKILEIIETKNGVLSKFGAINHIWGPIGFKNKW